MTLAVETKELTCRFGDFIAVNQLNLRIERGQIYGFLGSNGSGKSTTIRMLCGILSPTSGEGRVLGRDIVKEVEAIKQRIGYMSQKFSLYPDLTVRENLDFYAGLYGLSGAEKTARIAEMLRMAELESKQDAPVAALAGGFRQRLALGCAILHRPEMLFLDEPTGGVDPRSRRMFWQIIYALADAGTTVLVTTHFMDEAEHCDAVGFLYSGKFVASGSPDALKDSIEETLVSIDCADAVETLAAIRAAQLPLGDAYICGKTLRLLLGQETLPLLSQWSPQVVRPSMEDVFAYYVRKQREGAAK